VPSEATVVPADNSVRAGDLLTVDIDARALRDGSQHRVAIVPIGTPDAATSGAEFIRTTVPVLPDRVRVSLSAVAPGANEVRLYYVPPAGSAPVVAARAAVTVSGS
jgi:hypothetical protein